MNAVTLEKLARYLDRDAWNYDVEPEAGLIRTSFRGDHAAYHCLILFDAEKNRVRFLIPNYLVVPAGKATAKVYQRLLEMNMQYIMMKFGFDPRDGEVRAEIDLPVDDGDVSYEAFRRCLFCLVSAADESYPELMQLIFGEAAPASSGEEGEQPTSDTPSGDASQEPPKPPRRRT